MLTLPDQSNVTSYIPSLATNTALAQSLLSSVKLHGYSVPHGYVTHVRLSYMYKRHAWGAYMARICGYTFDCVAGKLLVLALVLQPHIVRTSFPTSLQRRDLCSATPKELALNRGDRRVALTQSQSW